MNPRIKIILLFALLLGAALRFYGLNWGYDPQTGEFHRFHTDESTIVESARLIGVDIYQIRSSYGKAPMYLLWAAAHTFGTIAGIEAFQYADQTSVQFTYLTARSISALMGVVLIFLVYQMGSALGGPWTGALAALLLAVCPGHIQQSHYYTVDPILTFWVTLALVLMLRLPSSDWRIYLAIGIVSGLAAGTRLVGVWLGIPFLIIHFIHRPRTEITATLKSATFWKHLGITSVAGLVVLLICEPFILLDPHHYVDMSDVRQFASSLRVASGDLIRVWTLYDFTTTPYLFYLTHLLRYALGAPLELAGLIGIGLVIKKRTQTGGLLLGWLLPYFLLVGGLHTKPIRYATPMLPAWIILGAWACVWFGQKLYTRRPHLIIQMAPALLIILPTLVNGLAIASIYGHEDSRIAAQRWVQENIPQGSHVLVEHGGFPTAWMAPEDQYQREETETSFFILSQNWMLYSSRIDFFRKKLTDIEWILLIEENRMRQFEAVPDAFPIGYQIYTRLTNETLGFKRVAQFKVQPTFLSWTRDESNAEPSITAFDHPTVSMFHRKPDSHPESIMQNWIENIKQSSNLPDRYILEGVSAFKNKDWEGARLAFQQALNVQSSFYLAHVLIAETYFQQNNTAEAERAWERAIEIAGRVPKYAFLGMIEAGLTEQGVIYLENLAKQDDADPQLLPYAGAIHTKIGLEYQKKGEHNAALESFLHAISLIPDYPQPYLYAVESLMEIGDIDGAEKVLERLEQRVPNSQEVQMTRARLYQKRDDLQSAYQVYEKALNLNPKDQTHQLELFKLGTSFYQRGQTDMAYTIFEKLLTYNPNFQEVHYNLGVMQLKAGDYRRAQHHLSEAVRIAPQDAEAHFALANTYEALKNIPEAIQHYQTVLNLNPNHADARARLKALSSP